MTLSSIIQLGAQCAKCGGELQIEITEPCIHNLRDSSIVSVVHDSTVECPHCRTTLGVMLAAVQGYMFRTVPVQKPGGGSIVLVKG